MIRTRVIPCLLLANEGLVKTINFKNPSYVGDPINAVKIFNDKEVDELILLDIDASKKSREPYYELVQNIVSEAFMPIAYGGGVKTVAQAKKLVESGVEKIVINTAALINCSLVKELVAYFGSSSTVVSIDIKKNWLGQYKLYNHTKHAFVKKSWQMHIQEMVDLGAGEIFITDVSQEGTFKGYNLDLIGEATAMIDVPLIACGGAGTIEHMQQAVKAGASAVAAGSMFVYMGKHRAVMVNYPKYELLEGIF